MQRHAHTATELAQSRVNIGRPFSSLQSPFGLGRHHFLHLTLTLAQHLCNAGQMGIQQSLQDETMRPLANIVLSHPAEL